jgi:hypothetical protein
LGDATTVATSGNPFFNSLPLIHQPMVAIRATSA